MIHQRLYERALEAINQLFSDTSVPASETRRSLQAVADDIGIRLEALPEGDESE
jgi:hypothetical protein